MRVKATRRSTTQLRAFLYDADQRLVFSTHHVLATTPLRVFLYGPEVGLFHPPRLDARLFLVEVAVSHHRLARNGRVAAEPCVRAARQR